MLGKSIRNYFAPILSLIMATSSLSISATTVELQTSEGNIHVNLFDEDTPQTVANFLSYVEDNSYTNTIFHRSIAGFIVQSGGFTIDGTETTAVPKKASVVNEPVFSNVSGTIAMAKVGGQPNSATSEWFFNLGNNSANLDLQNEGFTVFGQIITEGDDGAETVATLARIEDVQTCGELPLVDFDCNSDATPSVENYITINQVIVLDSSASTAANLSPARNTLIIESNSGSSGGDGGGSVFWMLMVLFASLSIRFAATRNHA